MTTRRGFLGAMLAAAMAPAVVKSSSLMKIATPKPLLLTLYGDGVHDDTSALQTLLAGGMVLSKSGLILGKDAGVLCIPSGVFSVTETLKFSRNNVLFENSDIHYKKPVPHLLEISHDSSLPVFKNMNFIASDKYASFI